MLINDSCRVVRIAGFALATDNMKGDLLLFEAIVAHNGHKLVGKLRRHLCQCDLFVIECLIGLGIIN